MRARRGLLLANFSFSTCTYVRVAPLQVRCCPSRVPLHLPTASSFKEWRKMTHHSALSTLSQVARAASCARETSPRTASVWPRWCRYVMAGRPCRSGAWLVSPTSLQSPFFDGKQPNWFHFSCFFKQCQPRSTGEVSGFPGLRPADQDLLRARIQGALQL